MYMLTMFSGLQITAAFSGLFAICAVLYRLISVTCWFCSTSTDVPFSHQNCWSCPSCEQYNGFKEDGDYNRIIPAQYDVSLNKTITSQSCSSNQSYNGLCSECNRNQLLIVSQLALFEPIKEKNYDIEIDKYHQHLEHMYKLCAPCKSFVQYELGRQDEILLKEMKAYKEKIASKKLICNPFNYKPASWIVHCLWLGSFVMSLLIILSNSFMVLKKVIKLPLVTTMTIEAEPLELFFTMTHFESFAALVLFLTATFCHGRSRLQGIDAICSFMWLPLIGFHFLTSSMSIQQLQEPLLLAQGCLSWLCCCLTMLTVVYHCCQTVPSPNSASFSTIPPEDWALPIVNQQSPLREAKKKNTENDVDLDENLDAMSLGPPLTKGNQKGNATFLPSVTSSSTSTIKLRKRPLVSPSRFSLPLTSHSSNSVPCSLCQSGQHHISDNSFFKGSFENCSCIQCHQIVHSSVSESTYCPEDFRLEPVSAVNLARNIKKNVWLPRLLGASLSANVLFVIYIYFGFLS